MNRDVLQQLSKDDLIALVLAQARQIKALTLTGVLPRPTPRLGYAFYIPSRNDGYIAYAESPLPSNKRSQTADSTGFGDYTETGQVIPVLFARSLYRAPYQWRVLLLFWGVVLSAAVVGGVAHVWGAVLGAAAASHSRRSNGC